MNGHHALSVCVLGGLASACVPLQRPLMIGMRPPFYCQGAATPAEVASAASAGSGTLMVQVTSPGALPVWGPSAPVVHTIWGGGASAAVPVDGGEGAFLTQARQVRLSIYADGAPVRQLAAVLSTALSLNVRVSPDVAEVPLLLALHETDLARLLELIAEDAGVSSAFRDGTLFLAAGGMGAATPPPLEVLLLPAASLAVPPEALLTVFCRDLASPWGSAAVLGAQLYLRDTEEALDRFRLLSAPLEHPREGGG